MSPGAAAPALGLEADQVFEAACGECLGTMGAADRPSLMVELYRHRLWAHPDLVGALTFEVVRDGRDGLVLSTIPIYRQPVTPGQRAQLDQYDALIAVGSA